MVCVYIIEGVAGHGSYGATIYQDIGYLIIIIRSNGKGLIIACNHPYRTGGVDAAVGSGCRGDEVVRIDYFIGGNGVGVGIDTSI